MTPPAITEAERDKLPDYAKGWLDALFNYAWWKDGTLYVGSTGTTYAQAVDAFLREKGYR